MGQLAIPIMMSVAAAGVSAYNTNQTAKKQDRATAEKIRRQGQKQREADARVNASLDEAAASNAAGDRAAALNEYVAQVRANRGNMTALGNQAGRVSGAFEDAANDAAMGVAAETGDRAELMATQDGATRMRDRENRGQVRLGGDLGLIRREADGLAYLDDMRIRNIRRNPWLDFASAALGALAGAGAGGAAAGAGSGAAATGMGMGSTAGIGAGLAGGTRYLQAAQTSNPFAMYGRGP